MDDEAAPLSGVRVLDLGRMVAAPWAGQMLGDLGADVIKIERLEGDDIRNYGPPFLTTPSGEELRESASSFACNRNKRSVAVDLNRPEGCEIVRRLAANADVVIENFKVGDLARRGLDYAAIKATNPDVIYCSVTGFGQTGPYARRPGVDNMFQAMSGIMSVTGRAEDEPQACGFVVVDVLTGLYAAIGVLAALRHRDNGGGGQHLDLALMDVGVAAMSHRATEYLMSGQLPRRAGGATPANVPSGVFKTAQGLLTLAAGGDFQFAKLCRALGRGDWLEDPRFGTRRARAANREAMHGVLGELLLARSAREWFSVLQAEGVFCAPVYDVAEAFDDPQARHRGLVNEVEHPSAGKVRLIANPLRFSKSALKTPRAPPMIGAHTLEVLLQQGFDRDELERLRAARVIGP